MDGKMHGEKRWTLRKKQLCVVSFYLSILTIILFSLLLQACAERAISGVKLSAQNSLNNQERKQSADVNLTSTGDQEKEKLLAQIRDEQLREKDPARVTKAIERLGDLKATEAIDDLVRLLTFRGSFGWEKGQTPGVVDHFTTPSGLYPATTALFQIGKPALPALEKVLEADEANPLEIENAINTVRLIYRDNPAEGAKFFRDTAARTLSPEAAKQLLQAADKDYELVPKRL